ncbi:MAG: hypothetical protein DRQ51_03445 [Gammaproteobacteria bacterium]|nr:MAG: hypothetical protein DRQ51_03445 [Gammaproteobacteria bacterium]
MIKWIKIIVGFLIIGFVLWFGYLNSDFIVVDIISTKIQASVALLIVLSFLLGVILTLIILLPKILFIQHKKKSLQKKLKQQSVNIDTIDSLVN